MSATNGMGLQLGTSSIRLNGSTIAAEVHEAVTDCAFKRTIDGASTMTLTVTDTARKLLRSPLFQQVVTATLDGLAFTLAKVEKRGDLLPLTFEAQAVARLRLQTGARSAAPRTTTRTAFAQRLVAETSGVSFQGYPEPASSAVALARTVGEDTWTCLTRLASEVGWRCFEVAGTVWFGPDSWLLGRPLAGTIRENTDGVDFIDFDHDVGKFTQTVTVNCTCDAWAYPTGAPVALVGMGIADGTKLVQDITRSLYFTVATVVLTAPQPVIAPATP